MLSFTVTTNITASPASSYVQINNGLTSSGIDPDYSSSETENAGSTTSARTLSNGDQIATRDKTYSFTTTIAGPDNESGVGGVNDIGSYTTLSNGQTIFDDGSNLFYGAAYTYVTTYNETTTKSVISGIAETVSKTTSVAQVTSFLSGTQTSFTTYQQETTTIDRSYFSNKTKEIRTIKTNLTTETYYNQKLDLTDIGERSPYTATILCPEPNEIIWVATGTFSGTCAISNVATSYYNEEITVLPSFSTTERVVLPQSYAVGGEEEIAETTISGNATTTYTVNEYKTIVENVNTRLPFEEKEVLSVVKKSTNTTWSATIFTATKESSATSLSWNITSYKTFSAQDESATYHITRPVSGTISSSAPFGRSVNTASDTTINFADPDYPSRTISSGQTFISETASNTFVLGFQFVDPASVHRVEKGFYSAAAKYGNIFGSNFNIGTTIGATFVKLNQSAFTPFPTTYFSLNKTIEIGANISIKDGESISTYSLNQVGDPNFTYVKNYDQAMRGANSPDGYTFLANNGLYLVANTSTSESTIEQQFSTSEQSNSDQLFYSAIPYVVGIGTMRYYVQTYSL